MGRKKKFRDYRNPELKLDTLVMDFADPIAFPCIKLYAKFTQDERLKSDLEERIRVIDARLRREEARMERKRAKWRRDNEKAKIRRKEKNK